MTGLELSERYYEAFGKAMIHEQFPQFEGVIAVGLCGSGSECLGYDDEISRDHDFEPGFCMFIPGEDVVDRRSAFLMERAYAKLPKEFEGFSKSMVSPAGGSRRGVIRQEDFLTQKLGRSDGRLTLSDWLTIPEQYILEVTNGKIYRDDSGAFSGVRERLARMPEDIRRKKLAGSILTMAQAGQYNYKRCCEHGEPAAAQMAIAEFVKAGIHTCMLLNGAYTPFYKWSFRALRRQEKLSLLAAYFEYLITTPNDGEYSEEKFYSIQEIAGYVIDELQTQGLTEAICGDLEKHAYSVNDSIVDGELRNMHIFAAV